MKLFFHSVVVVGREKEEEKQVERIFGRLNKGNSFNVLIVAV